MNKESKVTMLYIIDDGKQESSVLFFVLCRLISNAFAQRFYHIVKSNLPNMLLNVFRFTETQIICQHQSQTIQEERPVHQLNHY